MTYVVGVGEGKGLCKTWHLFLRLVCVLVELWGTPWLFFHSMLPLQGARSSIPGQGTKIPQVLHHGQKKKERKFVESTEKYTQEKK